MQSGWKRSGTRRMRAVIFLLFISLVPASSFAKVVLVLKTQGHYDNEQTEIRFEKNEWICKTKNSPYFLAPSRPFQTETLAAVLRSKSTPKSIEGCRDRIIVMDLSGSKKHTSYGCGEDKNFKKLFAEVERACGAN